MFHQAFGQMTTRKLAAERQGGSYALLFPKIPEVNEIIAAFMSEALVYLFEDLEELVALANLPRRSTPLTHDGLLKKVNNAIAKLEEVIPSPPLHVPGSLQSD